jgi:hypothetical protein
LLIYLIKSKSIYLINKIWNNNIISPFFKNIS